MYEKEEFVNLNTVSIHDIGAQIGHWQLKNMLHYFSKNELLLIFNKNLTLYDFITKKQQIICQLNYTPTCISTYNEIIGLGNETGEIQIIKKGRIVFTQKISNSIMNGIYLTEKYFLTGSNDCTIRIYSLEDYKLIYSVKHRWPVNNIYLKNNLLVATGDKNQIRITDFRSLESEENFIYFDTIFDASFGISINDSSNQLAIATQDGFVCIYDVNFIRSLLRKNTSKLREIFRNEGAVNINTRTSTSPIFTIPSNQFNARGSIRNVLFLSSNINLLLFTENMNYINIVDTRMGNIDELDYKKNFYQKRQTIEIGNNNLEITGLTFDGKNIFISTEQSIYQYRLNIEKRRRRK